MPIYEFLCEDCNRIFSFFARHSQTARRRPGCPKCGGRRMNKRFSRFAMATSSAIRAGTPAKEGGGGGEPDVSPEQEARMERAMMGLAGEMDSIDESNPRQMASVIRRLADATGEPIDGTTDEMIRRLEAGEDPDKVEERMAEAFGGDEAGAGLGSSPSYDGGLYDL